MNKKSLLPLIAAVACASAAAQTPEVTLTRLDCASANTAPSDVARFSDTFALEGKKIQLTVSCYLIKHGSDYMIWDVGYPTAASGLAQGNAPTVKTPLVDQLAQLNIRPDQIKYVGISHYHGDHIGQAGSFPNATLLIGKGDWDALTGAAGGMVNPAPLKHWVSGNGKVEPVVRDKDVFGDGTVVMLDTPGHTPGHHSLLVRLKEKGNVLLTGDLAHFHENYESNGVPTFNTHRGDTLASLDRFKAIAKNLNAIVIIQHDARDIDKLPPFPQAAK
ncbi:MAG TPA: N-acyl homoserine lactonase family protein [Steroidobacteraceae bacterium]